MPADAIEILKSKDIRRVLDRYEESIIDLGRNVAAEMIADASRGRPSDFSVLREKLIEKV